MFRRLNKLIHWIWDNRNRRIVTIASFLAALSNVLLLYFAALPELALLISWIMAHMVSTLTREKYLALGASCIALMETLTLLLLAPVLPNPLDHGAALMLAATFYLLLMMSMITNIHQQEYLSTEEADRQMLYKATVNELLQARGLDTIFPVTVSAVSELYGRPCILFAKNAEGHVYAAGRAPAGLLFYQAELDAADAVFSTGLPAGRFEETCRYSPFLYFPLKSEDETVAVLGLLYSDEDFVDITMLDEFLELTRHAGKAIGYQLLADRQQAALLAQERERMRADFLRGMSHDIRSPLTGIMSACSTLLQSGEQIAPEVRTHLLNNIHEESEGLCHMVENLLSVTRVNTVTAPVQKSPELAEDIIGEVAARCAKRFPELKLCLSTPSEPLMVPMDATLIIQVLMNLVENAAKYSGSEWIAIHAAAEDGFAVFTVQDWGVGLSQKIIDGLFAPIDHSDQDGGHGLGIGLSICQSIIRAHGGTITGKNDPEEGGAIFTFTLPMEHMEEMEELP